MTTIPPVTLLRLLQRQKPQPKPVSGRTLEPEAVTAAMQPMAWRVKDSVEAKLRERFERKL